jgi:hypothetical protein
MFLLKSVPMAECLKVLASALLFADPIFWGYRVKPKETPAN